ncbi:hypothetical protein RJ640_022302 [Escallonia rubra]|uniref:Transposase (putative) gypsy type domain-containing protein n=1 Tax=Escallonia rubra TaxID=112253 RepID=A0AA88QBF2_9ASTE|nr:hypothetical protein RJ640_022302 [Escallonia rubra]
MSTEDLQDLIREYPLPEGWYARLPGLGEPANYGTKFETGVYEEQVKSGYRLPLHPFALRFFEHYRMAPGQLVPNGWRKLAGLIYLVQTSGYKPDVKDFMRAFFEICFVKGVANCPGWYYIHSRQRLLKGGPKSNKGWHSKYFFVGRMDKGELLFDRDWNPYCKDFENPGKLPPNNLTKHILSHMKLRGGLCIDEPLLEEQLEWAKIIPPKPIPAGLLIHPPPPAFPSMSSAETVSLEMASESGKSQQGGFLNVLQKAKGKRKEKQPSAELPLLLRGLESLFQNALHRFLSNCLSKMILFFVRDGHSSVMPLGCRTASGGRGGSATHRAEELSKQEEDHLAQIAALEKRLERVKRRAAEEVTKAGDQGIRDFLDGKAGDEWLKKRTEDGLEIYELGYAKAKEMFAERFPDIPLDDFVLPAVVSPSGVTAMPLEAGDAAASHLPGESPSESAKESSTLARPCGGAEDRRHGKTAVAIEGTTKPKVPPIVMAPCGGAEDRRHGKTAVAIEGTTKPEVPPIVMAPKRKEKLQDRTKLQPAAKTDGPTVAKRSCRGQHKIERKIWAAQSPPKTTATAACTAVIKPTSTSGRTVGCLALNCQTTHRHRKSPVQPQTKISLQRAVSSTVATSATLQRQLQSARTCTTPAKGSATLT